MAALVDREKLAALAAAVQKGLAALLLPEAALLDKDMLAAPELLIAAVVAAVLALLAQLLALALALLAAQA